MARSINIVVVKMFSKTYLLLVLFLLPFVVEAKSRVEGFIAEHPFIFILFLLGGSAVLVVLILIPTYLMQKFGKESREYRKREILKDIPKEKVNGVHLPPATIYFIGKNQQKIERRELPQDREFLIGRGAINCDLTIKDKRVSWEHAKIRPEEEGYILYDLASNSGVKVNGRKVLKKKLENGDKIKIGRHTILFECLPKDAEERRKHLRISVPLECAILSKPDESFSGVTRDISLGGVKFEVHIRIPLESVLEYQISFDATTIEGLGVVRWIKPILPDKKRYLVGMEFLELSEKAKKKLEQLIIQQITEEE
ncbi:MAG: FHA domain-containing protein [Caldiserica bacterium]|nr:FHA domain-containing protein [Caldisericota bacterium]